MSNAKDTSTSAPPNRTKGASFTELFYNLPASDVNGYRCIGKINIHKADETGDVCEN